MQLFMEEYIIVCRCLAFAERNTRQYYYRTAFLFDNSIIYGVCPCMQYIHCMQFFGKHHESLP